jgi:hypothetical protein
MAVLKMGSKKIPTVIVSSWSHKIEELCRSSRGWIRQQLCCNALLLLGMIPDQGCQSLLGATNQNGKKITNDP